MSYFIIIFTKNKVLKNDLGRIGLTHKNTGQVMCQPVFASDKKKKSSSGRVFSGWVESSRVRKFWPILPCLIQTLVGEHAILRVCLVERVEKWDDRKWGKNRKIGGYKRFSFLSYLFGWEDEKVEIRKTIKKWNWYKFTIMSLLNKTNRNTIFYTHLFI